MIHHFSGELDLVSTLDSGTMESLYASFASFYEPAYTFIIKLPLRDWKNIQSSLQRTIKGGPWHDILDTEEDFKRARNSMGLLLLMEKHFQSDLCTMAHWAARREFERKQATTEPQYSCYAQVELSDQVHVHLVLGGTGLNKYTAKAWRNTLAYNFFSQVEQRQKEILGPHYNSVEWLAATVPISLAKNECFQNYTKNCTILQYRARNGDMYACRVNPKEFCANYMLPKQLWLNTYTTVEDLTPDESYFPQTTKSYSYTTLNGEVIRPEHRRRLQFQLLQDFNGQQSEPIFGGDPLSDLPKVERATWQKTSQPAGKMTKREGLVLDCMQRAVDGDLLTYEQMVDAHPELVIMLESQAGGGRLIEQTLSMAHIKITQKYTALSYILKRYPEAEVEADSKVFRLMNLQGYNAWQAGHWIATVLNKKAGKQNSICFYGPASTGKTNIAKAIANCVKLYGCVNHLNKNFVFNDCAAKLVIWWEECLMHQDWVEQAKCCMGGTEFRIDRKHKESQLLPQTPVLISTNNDIYTCVGGNVITHVHSKPLKDRVVQFNFMKSLESTFGEISEQEIADWLVDCSRRFECTLEGFYRQWGVRNVPNDFFLNKLCASHSQDFTLHEHGLCLDCGGYLPLREDPESAEDNDQTFEPGRELDNLLSQEVMRGTLNFDTEFDFDLSLLEPASTHDRKRLHSTDEGTAAEEEPEEKRHKVNWDYVSRRFASQPEDEFDQREYEELVREAMEEEEPQPEPGPGLTPSEWGERLGIIVQAVEEGEPPIVLHCFENLSESDEETAQSF